MESSFNQTLNVSGGVVISWLLSAVTVFGNSLVILAFITEKSLRSNPTDLFILNLSVADFLVGAFSFPLYTLWLMFGYWPFGEGVCKMWLIIDYTACAVSVCGIILISLDRYWMLKMKLKYRQFQTTKRVTVMIITTWIICILLYAIPIFCWKKFTGKKVEIDYSENCYMESGQAYKLVCLFFSFVIPLPIIIYLNSTVYKEIRQRTRRNHSVLNRNKSVFQAASVNTTMSSMRRHRKAAITLAVLVSVFAICWAPYNVVLIWNRVSDNSLDYIFVEVVTYLLWSNSAINPFLYALTNLKIRNVFFKFFCLKFFK
ncbi:histamine H3 receptor-like [Antedon mediterranea]|uniref:histamine H3 receptor-like n=1 Tax=Antedon mediterranea TaxID=105859 RepID=UPI003AF841EA